MGTTKLYKMWLFCAMEALTLFIMSFQKTSELNKINSIHGNTKPFSYKTILRSPLISLNGKIFKKNIEFGICMKVKMLHSFIFCMMNIRMFWKSTKVNDILCLNIFIYIKNQLNLQVFCAYKMLGTRSLFRHYVITFGVYERTEPLKVGLHLVNISN